jgi:hypothetical protein
MPVEETALAMLGVSLELLAASFWVPGRQDLAG